MHLKSIFKESIIKDFKTTWNVVSNVFFMKIHGILKFMNFIWKTNFKSH